MIEKIIQYSVKNKLITGIFLLVFVGWGVYSTTNLSIDALPDVTNNQVQVITSCPNLATQEVEQFITYPIEMQMKTIPDVTELRSISRSGLSVITVVFKDKIPVNITRQQVSERLKIAEEDLQKDFGTPEILPPTTGLGEIYQYTIAPKKGFEKKYSAMDLRTIQDWIVRRQLIGTAGVVDVSTFGGYLKQYEVAVAPEKLVSMNISLTDVFDALSKNNQNTGGSYIDKGPNIYFIRGEGLIESLQDIENIVVKNVNGIPIKIHDISKVQFGYAPRYGAMTRNGQGEAVGGVVLMLKGENSVKVIADVKERMKSIEKNLPEGLTLDVFVDRTKLIDRTIGTVSTNLIEGALIVIFVLILLLGNLRAGLIVASVIPLSMLFAISLMNVFGVTANLMSMGALDFGLIVDGAVIVVESMLYIFTKHYRSNTLSQSQMDKEIIGNSSKIMSSAVFGQIIILIVYIPIFALTGIEGKMFLPMAQTVSFAIIGALLLSLTYVPLMSSLFLNKKITHKESLSDRFIAWCLKFYIPFLKNVLKHKTKVVGASLLLLIAAIFLFNSLGGEFIPELDEGDFAIESSIRQGSSLPQTILTFTQLESILKSNFPEVIDVVSKIGTAEVPTDPMPVNTGDIIIILKDKKEWTTAQDKDELAEKMSEKMNEIPGVQLSFEHPIQMRFNELIAGVKTDIAIKIFGENLDVLFDNGNKVSKIISGVDGVTDIKVEQVVGMPQLVVKYNRARIAQYGLNIFDVNKILNTALAGGKAGVVYDGERKFDLIVRLDKVRDADEEKVKNIFVPLPNGTQIPLSQIAEVNFQSAPAQISRDDAERRIVVEANVRGRDIQSVVEDIQKKLDAELKLPSGYFITYGGTFQNLQEAKNRLSVAVPAALLLIFLLLFFSFRSITESLIIFSAIPLAAIGGVVAIWLRGMNFSISAGIGFIALFGVAVLNGIVLIAYFNRLRDEGEENVTERILKGTAARLRPVIATAAVASLGFLPMALSTSAGSEVQKPLATVVIGGLISSTLLTLIVLPVLYALFIRKKKIKIAGTVMILIFLFSFSANAQSPLSLDSAINLSLKNHPLLRSSEYTLQQQQLLKKTIFTLDPLNMAYTGGQINSSVNDYNITATTGIKFPTEILAQSQYQKQQIALALSQLNVTKATLVKNVSLAYVLLQYSLQQLNLLDSLEIIYTNFSKFADKKYSVGETGLLEKVSAHSQLKEIQLKKQEAESNLKIYQNNLKQWIGTTENIAVSTIENFKLPIPQLTDTSALKTTPLFLLQKQQLNVTIANYKLEKAKFSPSINFGYFNQSLDKVKPFNGFMIGTSIPIFKTGQQGRTKSAQLGIKISEMELQNFQLNLNTAYTEALQQFNKHNQSLNYYQTEGLNLASTLFTVANKSYQSGDIGYTEFILNIQNAYDIRSNYLLTLNNYNQSIINLNYLINK
ncbi:MAG: CusA/CzcA family heavy metal efflux RND transporter [Chitinophagaceae bacterium]|nr:MAG: CusA/CzcA family heavy metal efflux RND transporter [Chitinophagaceae bacterium]